MNKQITQYIESEKYDKVIIRENHEPMIKVQATDKIIIAHKDYPAHKFVRETIWKKLLKASLNLPDEYKIKFLEGYRPLWKQKEYWDDECAKTRQAHPNWTEEKIQKEANRFVARPTKLANHRCGGAIDIGLIYNDGTSVDMGINHLSSKEDYNSGKNSQCFLVLLLKNKNITERYYELLWKMKNLFGIQTSGGTIVMATGCGRCIQGKPLVSMVRLK